MEEEKTQEVNNLGFIYEPVDEKDWQLGSAEFGREVILPSGDWTPYLPAGEEQARAGVETMACVSFSACNNVEAIFNWMIDNDKISVQNLIWLKNNGYIDGNGKFESSDRFVAKFSGTGKNGNSLKNVGEAIRKTGLVPENKWPFATGMSWAEYYKYPSTEAIKLGRDFLERFQINYEVVPESQNKEGLKYSPLQTAVHAWNGQDGNGIYIRNNGALNHAISLIKVASNLIKSIFDHYKIGNSFIKFLAADFNLMDYSYRYLVTEKQPPKPAPLPYNKNVVFITPVRGYLNSNPQVYLEKGTGLTKEEAFIWVADPDVGETLPAIQYDVNPTNKEDAPTNGWLDKFLWFIKNLFSK